MPVTELAANRIQGLIDKNYDAVLAAWTSAQTEGGRRSGVTDSGIRSQAAELLSAIRQALNKGGTANVEAPQWGPVRELLEHMSASRALQGSTPTETATFVLSLKAPLFELMRTTGSGDASQLMADVSAATDMFDKLALYTTDVFLRTREDRIVRQQQDMLELSTPVVKLWDGVLALPMIGTLDSARTQVVMESLLQRIVETEADVAILDITGVPTVDTLTAQYLLKTVTAARLMGAECIISGIRPQIAQTIVHLGVDLGDVITKATLADAFKLALSRAGLVVTRPRAATTDAAS